MKATSCPEAPRRMPPGANQIRVRVRARARARARVRASVRVRVRVRCRRGRTGRPGSAGAPPRRPACRPRGQCG
eukprot:scaffold35941_cov38-Phaeocystis_antarctica.AAC.2